MYRLHYSINLKEIWIALNIHMKQEAVALPCILALMQGPNAKST